MFDLKAEVTADKDCGFLKYANKTRHSMAKLACLYELNENMSSRMAMRACEVLTWSNTRRE